VYVEAELAQKKVPPPAPNEGFEFLFYCSKHNEGCAELLVELASSQKVGVQGLFDEVYDPYTTALPSPAPPSRYSTRFANVPGQGPLWRVATTPRSSEVGSIEKGSTPVLKVSTKVEELDKCEHMLIYLTAKTWQSTFSDEVSAAFHMGVHPLVLHEMPGTEGQYERRAASFDFFLQEATPKALIRAGIYKDIAITLHGGGLRQASLGLLMQRVHQEQQKKRKPPTLSVAEALRQVNAKAAEDLHRMNAKAASDLGRLSSLLRSPSKLWGSTNRLSKSRGETLGGGAPAQPCPSSMPLLRRYKLRTSKAMD